ncbi:MAG: 3,4-dihydroxy-2-butanone-4-phosphate synthase [Pseudomonadota bacterium]
MQNNYKTRVEKAISDLKKGKIILLHDNQDRENEADMIFAAEMATAEKVNFLIQHGSGIVCLAMTGQQAKRLDLSLLQAPQENNSQFGTPFTKPIGAKQGITTGISAADRAHTILTAMAEHSSHDDLSCPGHVFPLIANAQGVLKRQGHTEGTVDLMKLAGLKPAGVLCELVNSDGSVAKGEQIEHFAKTHQLTQLDMADLIQYRLRHEPIIELVAESTITLKDTGIWTISIFNNHINQKNITVLHRNTSGKKPLVRVHSACFTGETLGSLHCDCQQQLHDALAQIGQQGGYLIYLDQEGRGIGLTEKIRAYDLQHRLSIDTYAANRELGFPEDQRDYISAVKVLHFYKEFDVKLLTNNPDKVDALEKYDIAIEQVNMKIASNAHNHNYLQAKIKFRQHNILLS